MPRRSAAPLTAATCSRRRAEAAALMRDSPSQFEANVRSSLRGGTLRIQSKDKGVAVVTFPKLI